MSELCVDCLSRWKKGPSCVPGPSQNPTLTLNEPPKLTLTLLPILTLTPTKPQMHYPPPPKKKKKKLGPTAKKSNCCTFVLQSSDFLGNSFFLAGCVDHDLFCNVHFLINDYIINQEIGDCCSCAVQL